MLSGLRLDCFDLTATLDEGSHIRPRIAFQVGKDQDQDPPASEASASRVAIGGVGYRDDPMGERYWSLQLCPTFIEHPFLSSSVEGTGNTREEDEPEASGGTGRSICGFFLAHHVLVAETSHRNLPLGDVNEAIEKFGPLRDVLGAIPAVYANHEVCQQPLSQIVSSD